MTLQRGSKGRKAKRPVKLLAEDSTYLLAENDNRLLLEKYRNRQSGVNLFAVAADAYDLAHTNSATDRQEAIVSLDVAGTVYQVIAYWDSSGNMAFAKRTLPSDSWTIYSSSPAIAVGAAPADAHDYITIGVDPDGYIHVAYDMHNEALKYRVSSATIATFNGALGGASSMVGTNETSVTYLNFLHDSSNNLYCVFRDGDANAGDTFFYSYDEVGTTWSAATGTGTGGLLIDGKNESPAEASYHATMRFDDSDNLHIAWIWREVGNTDSYHDLAYCKWNGTSFLQAAGGAQTVPITQANDDVADAIAQGSGLTPVPQIDADSSGNPHILYFYNDSDGNRQIRHAWYSGGWIKKQITNFDGLNTYKFFVIDRTNDEVIILWVNSRKENRGLFVEESNPADYTAWRRRRIDDENWYLYGVFFDWQRWNSSGVLEMVVNIRFINPATWPVKFARLAI